MIALNHVNIDANAAGQNAAKLQKPTECMFFEKKSDVGLWIKSGVHSGKMCKTVDKWAKTLVFQAFPVENPVEIVGNCGFFHRCIQNGDYASGRMHGGGFTKNTA